MTTRLTDEEIAELGRRHRAAVEWSGDAWVACAGPDPDGRPYSWLSTPASPDGYASCLAAEMSPEIAEAAAAAFNALPSLLSEVIESREQRARDRGAHSTTHALLDGADGVLDRVRAALNVPKGASVVEAARKAGAAEADVARLTKERDEAREALRAHEGMWGIATRVVPDVDRERRAAEARAAELERALAGVLMFCNADGSPCDGFRLREEVLAVRAALRSALDEEAAGRETVTCRGCERQRDGYCAVAGSDLSDPDAPFTRSSCPDYAPRWTAPSSPPAPADAIRAAREEATARCERCNRPIERRWSFCPACGRKTPSDWENARITATGAPEAKPDAGLHTKHCASRLLWGDGQCECGANAKAAPADPSPTPTEDER